jgi:hypothetical protein
MGLFTSHSLFAATGVFSLVRGFTLPHRGHCNGRLIRGSAPQEDKPLRARLRGSYGRSRASILGLMSRAMSPGGRPVLQAASGMQAT